MCSDCRQAQLTSLIRPEHGGPVSRDKPIVLDNVLSKIA
jgi:hypothetical protein